MVAPCKKMYLLSLILKKEFELCIPVLVVCEILHITSSIPNYKTFDFFDTKFDHSSYSKIYVKYHFFRRGLVY